MKRVLVLLGLVFLFQGCSSSQKWGPDVHLLKRVPVPENGAFERDMVRFYELFRDKKWEATYIYRTKQFKSIVSKDVYLKSFDQCDKSWHVYNYNVKSVTVSAEVSVQLVIELFEAKKQVSNFRVVDWVFEDGAWRIENDGSTRSPFGNKIILKN